VFTCVENSSNLWRHQKFFLTSLSSVQTLGKKYSSSLSERRGRQQYIFFTNKDIACKWYITLLHTAGKLDWRRLSSCVVCAHTDTIQLLEFDIPLPFFLSFLHERTQTWLLIIKKKTCLLKLLWLHLSHCYLLNEHISITTNYLFFLCVKERRDDDMVNKKQKTL